MRLTLIGRSYCHLCEAMRAELNAALISAGGAGESVEIVEIDLDAHPAFEDRFSELVPVLLLGEPETGVEICHYHFDRFRWTSATGLAFSDRS
ncbi:MAG: glutaredoxin family protein [Rhodocyclaceae bacterium]|nr:glutaredoxin family protein [Rhodocyclaceae bacterium]